MEEIILNAQKRQEVGTSKVKDLREKGFISAVVYGEGKYSFPIKVSHRHLVQLVHQHRLESAIINLKIEDDGGKKTRPCLIKEIQYDPVKGDIVHVDFNEISLTKSIKVNVPVITVGEAPGVKQEGGSLEHILWEIEVECLPTDIPKGIEVDISQLKMGDSVHIKDLKSSDKYKIMNDTEAIVLSVAAPMKEEVVAEAVEGEEAKEPEVIKEKKETPEEAAAEDKEKAKEKESK
ncbi:MAG TPA: 50S ribosomal protein L25 [Patescibacteria group bacterium]|nr:50S ribosomal protein L25 [Patescibacteria group bacterium]